MASPRPFHFDRTWTFALSAEELWDAICRTEDYPRWWSWLREFDSVDGLTAGSDARCVVRAPLPYSLRLHIHIHDVEAMSVVAATVSGDLDGRARLEIRHRDDGSCDARLVWTVVLTEPRLRTAARLARPVLEWGHEWVVNTGVAQFRRRALDELPR